MIPDEAPPPYSVVDPLLLQTNGSSNSSNVDIHTAPQQQFQPPLRLRGGEAPSSDAISSDGSSGYPVSRDQSSSIIPPVNFASAAGFFEERPPPPVSVPAGDEQREILRHHMTIYPRSQAKDFPRRPRCWNRARAQADGTNEPNNEIDITQQDWDTFLSFLFPPHLGPAASSAHLPRRLRAEIARDRKDRPQETDEEREARIAAVIAEWNQGFFLPRGTCVSWVYVKSLENTPASPLCPRCYPAATAAAQVLRDRGVAAAAAASSSSGPLEGQDQGQGQAPVEQLERLPRQRQAGPQESSQSPASTGSESSSTPAAASPQCKPPFPWPLCPGGSDNNNNNNNESTPPNHCPWGWRSQSLPLPRNAPSCPGAPWRGAGSGPFSWMSELGARAQKFGEQISEQALRYGRMVEEQARAQAQWIEEQARYHGRQIEQIGDSLSNLNLNKDNSNGSSSSSSSNKCPWPSSDPRSARRSDGASDRNNGRRRSRSSSTSSSSSSASTSSLSSIDSISTTSDLDAEDLAAVRAQLLSLNDYHHRDLHAAAVALRRQLHHLQQSRRRARFNNNNNSNNNDGRGGGFGFGGRGGGRGAWGRGHQHYYHHPHPHHHPHPGFGRGWYRWEAPPGDHQQRQRPATDERAMKELRAVKRAFRDVVRRARREERELRRSRRRRRDRDRDRDRNPSLSLELDSKEDRPGIVDADSTNLSSSSSSSSSTSSSSSSSASINSESKGHVDADADAQKKERCAKDNAKDKSKEARKRAKEQRKREEKLRKQKEKQKEKEKKEERKAKEKEKAKEKAKAKNECC